MKGYINIPKTIYVKRCSECGARPIIALAGEAGYMVKCPANNAHYHTLPGLIDLEDWNQHNKTLSDNDYSLNSAQSIQFLLTCNMGVISPVLIGMCQ